MCCACPRAPPPPPCATTVRPFPAGLPVASYAYLRDEEDSAKSHGGRTPDGAAVGPAAADTTEQSDARGLQHHLTQPIMKAQFKAFLQLLEQECSGEEGLWELARAQHRSFAGGGTTFMESYIPPAAVRSWHARMFLRSALRLLPEEVEPGSVWTCPRPTCRLQRTGLAVIAHASCEKSSSRHHSLVDGLMDVFAAFPGHPQLRLEVQEVPAEHCRMDIVVDGAWTGTPGKPGEAPDRRRLLVDASMPEPMSVEATGPLHSWRVDGAAAAAAVRDKEKKYGNRIPDGTRSRLVPFVVETWGRLSTPAYELLKATALLAARRECGRDSCSTDDGEERRDAQVAATILRGWLQRVSAAVVAAQAEQLDRVLHPLAGSVARQAYARFAPRGTGGGVDCGLLGVTGHVRNAEPRFVCDVF